VSGGGGISNLSEERPEFSSSIEQREESVVAKSLSALVEHSYKTQIEV
jgi:hypothetical protein